MWLPPLVMLYIPLAHVIGIKNMKLGQKVSFHYKVLSAAPANILSELSNF